MTNSPRAHQPRFRRLLAVLSALGAFGALGGAVSAATLPIGAYTKHGAWHFVSAPNLHPPKMLVLSHHGGLAKGYFLVDTLPNTAAPGPMIGEGGPLILDNHMRPVWSYPVGTQVGSADLQQESYQGSPVLTWWEGVVNRYGITTQGKVLVVNQHYKHIATLKAAKPWIISLHDAVISGPNIWVTVYRQVSAHSGHWHGTVYDCGVQEYNLATKKLLYTWDALNPGGAAHIPLSYSKQPPPAKGKVWDAYHLNSVQPLASGQFLVSLRNTWGVYLINPTTSHTVWTLGGKNSTFKFGKGAQFAWQHHAELVSSSTGLDPNEKLTVFNDNCTYTTKYVCQGGKPSAGLELNLNTLNHTATLVAAFRHNPPLQSAFLGSMQLLSGGGAVVGFGTAPYFSEYSSSGKQLLDVQFPGNGKEESYRALFTSNWVGTPAYPPSGAVRSGHGKTTVYASWNGATQVVKWEVLAGSSASHLKNVATARRSGFETAIALKQAATYYEVRALDSSGHTLGTSHPFK